MSTTLLPGWTERLKAYETQHRAAQTSPPVVAKVDVPRIASTLRVITAEDSAEQFLRVLGAANVSAIAIEMTCESASTPLTLRSGRPWRDIRSLSPILASVAAWVHAAEAETFVLRAVLDLRQPDVAAALDGILKLRVVHVFHDVKRSLFAFWNLGIDPGLHQLYDTWIAAACLDLGRFHERALLGHVAQVEFHAIDRLRAESLSLLGLCERYGIAACNSRACVDLEPEIARRMRANGLDRHVAALAAVDPELILRVYVAQQRDVLECGPHAHLHGVEFPFAIANARIQWNGLALDRDRRASLRSVAAAAAERQEAILLAHGAENPRSACDFEMLLERLGLAAELRRDGEVHLDDDVLKDHEHRHEVFRAFRLQRKFRRLANEEWLLGLLDGADGRIHPEHRQLGSSTGRSTCTDPSLTSLDRVLRPIVIAPHGRALIELDFEQMEVGIAAAEHGDLDLIAAYNAGDVYAPVAQRIYAEQLSPEERTLDAKSFKARHSDLREKAKTMVLAALYGIQPTSLARKLKIRESTAAEELQRLLDLYPTLRNRFEASIAEGLARGYAVTVTGLRRRLPEGKASRGWSRNLLRNTPVQGSAASVFKRAIVELDRAFRGTEIRLVMPMHDSILIEVPIEAIDDVARSAAEHMRHAVRSTYPQLQPRVSGNAIAPHCWNKDGHADSLERFLDDPEYRIGRASKRTRQPHCAALPHILRAQAGAIRGWRDAARLSIIKEAACASAPSRRGPSSIRCKHARQLGHNKAVTPPADGRAQRNPPRHEDADDALSKQRERTHSHGNSERLVRGLLQPERERCIRCGQTKVRERP